jgi:eukaryotic-like serine/threonine-protein kinase
VNVVTHRSDSAACPVCGSAKSGVLNDNCPTCLMRLGTSVDDRPGESIREDRTSSADSISWNSTSAGQILNRRLGEYEILEEIARGGMGVIYRARQTSLNRTVALKVLLTGHFANPTAVRRFRLEAEAAASLSHPNIVSIYEVGEEQGLLYFSMKLIEGRSLAELTRDKPLPALRAAQLAKTIAEAIHSAHEQRLLHRDLKPSNILIDAFGAPHITDFGLAKREDRDADLTLSGQVLGTPNYMPPEQAEPKGAQTTAASDIYSLGAILYQMLTGRPPFMAETLPQTLRLVAEAEPVSPRLLNPGVPRDLETICLKCLEKDPQRRYNSGEELARELNRFLRDEPICARPVGLAVRSGRWCRRKPALALASGTVAALLLVIAIGSPVAILRINSAREHAEAAREQEAMLRQRAQAAEQQIQRQLYTALLEQARATVLSGELGHRVRALDALRRAATLSSNHADLRREVFAALALPDLRFERELRIEPEPAAIELDPDFKRLALCRGRGAVEIRDAVDNRLLTSLGAATNLPAHNAKWSATGRFLAVKRDSDPAGERAELEVWDTLNVRRVLLIQNVSWQSLSFHPHLPRLMTGGADGVIVEWDLENAAEIRQVRTLALHTAPEFLKYSPEGSRFAVVSWPGGQWRISVHRFGVVEPMVARDFPENMGSIEWHPNGRWLALADEGSSVHLMDSESGETRLLGHQKLQAVLTAFSPDGRYLISAGWEGEFICWDLQGMKRSFGVALESWRLQFSGDGKRCAVIAKTGVKFYGFERPIDYREFAEDLGGRLERAVFSPNGRWLAASSAERLGIWDLATGGPGALVNEARQARMFFTPDSSELFASGHKPFRWRLTPAADLGAAPRLQRLPFDPPQGFVSLCLVSNSVAVTSSRGTQLVPLNGEINDDHWRPTASGLTGASPDGQFFAVFPPYGDRLRVYELPGLDEVANLGAADSINWFQFSGHGNELTIASRQQVDFWNTTSWERKRTLPNFMGMFFTPDGNNLWLIRDFRTAGLYDARTLELLLPLPLGTVPLALSQDGQRLAVSIDRRRLQLWDLNAVHRVFRELGLDWEQESKELPSSPAPAK